MKHYFYSVILILSVYLFVASFAIACDPGETSAGTPPSGDITVDPNVMDDSGNYAVAAGNTLTLTASDLADEDCYCGAVVEDSIDESTGVTWHITNNSGDGTLSTTSGSTITYTAPTEVSGTDEVELDLVDNATAPKTFKDNTTPQKATSAKVHPVLPDTDTVTYSGASCSTGHYGKSEWVQDQISNSTAAGVDWTGYELIEVGPVNHVVADSCGVGAGGAGGTVNIGHDGKPTAGSLVDKFLFCPFTDPTTPDGLQCGHITTTQWQYQVPGGSPVNFFQREYDYITDTSGNYNLGTQSTRNF